MRVLFITPYVPSIVRIRPYALIRELARRGHQVTLACLVQPDWEAEYLPGIASYCSALYPVYLKRIEPPIHTIASLPTRVPLSVAYCRSSSFDRLVQKLLESGNFDLLHTEFLRAAPITLRLTGLPRVFDAVDSMALAYGRSRWAPYLSAGKRIIAWLEWFKMRTYEPWAIKQYDRVVVSSPIDQQMLNRGGVNAELILNGVDLDYFSYSEGIKEDATIIFLGKMSYYVNIASVLWFYQEVLPLICKVQPNIRFQVVGRTPSPEIIALKEDPAVEVTGTVLDVRPYLTRATLSVNPMVTGAGMQFKILEAMAVGTPCVSTSVASQALQIQSGQDVLVEDDPGEFARAVLDLLNDARLRRQLAENGRRYVERYHDWRQIGHQLDSIYSELA